jgi:hypothetical protein
MMDTKARRYPRWPLSYEKLPGALVLANGGVEVPAVGLDVSYAGLAVASGVRVERDTPILMRVSGQELRLYVRYCRADDSFSHIYRTGLQIADGQGGALMRAFGRA